MKLQNWKRSYTSVHRAKKVEDNNQRVLDAVTMLWKGLPLGEITLDKIAENAGVTVRTILRKFGSREGLFQACVKKNASSVTSHRDKTSPGDLENILDDLLKEYEESGDASVRTLAAENEIEVAAEIIRQGRAYHKKWCARVFRDYLPGSRDITYKTRLMSFVAVTDVYVWKLLRRDSGLSYAHTRQVMKNMLECLINQNS